MGSLIGRHGTTYLRSTFIVRPPMRLREMPTPCRTPTTCWRRGAVGGRRFAVVAGAGPGNVLARWYATTSTGLGWIVGR
jgi:hypothetical protein